MTRLLPLFLIAFLVGADEFLLGPVLTPIGNDLSVPPERVALFVSAYSLPLAIMAPILGGLSDRHGRLVVLVPATFVFGLASLATSSVTSFEAAIATRIVTGAASGGMLGIAMAIAGDMSGRSAARAIAAVQAGLTVGIILGPAIASASAELWSWRLAFAALGVIALAVGLVGRPMLRSVIAVPRDAGRVAHREGLFVPGAAGSLIAMAAGLGGAISCFALIGERMRGLYGWETASIGMIYVAFGLLTLVGNLLMPAALARIGSGRALMRVALVCVLGAIVLTHVPPRLPVAAFLAALAVWAVLGGMGAPGLQAHVAQLSPTRRGALMALAGSCMNLGVAAGTAIVACVRAAGDEWVAAVAIVMIGSAVLALRPPRASLAAAG